MNILQNLTRKLRGKKICHNEKIGAFYSTGCVRGGRVGVGESLDKMREFEWVRVFLRNFYFF